MIILKKILKDQSGFINQFGGSRDTLAQYPCEIGYPAGGSRDYYRYYRLEDEEALEKCPRQ